MKAVQIEKYGEADELKVQNVENPKPKNNEILVRIFDAGVNPFDWKVRRGYMKDIMPMNFPLTMGYDFAGEVAEVGSGITDYKKGDKVFGFTQGAYAEYAISDVNHIAKIPAGISTELAASLPTPALTAYQIITNHIQARGAKEVLIHGAAGSVGSIAVQVAKSYGITVYGTAAKEDESFLRDLGVTAVIDYKTQKFEQSCSNLDAIVDLVGGDTLTRSFQCVKKGGIIVSTVAQPPENLVKETGVEGKYFLTNQNSEDLTAIAKLVSDGKLKVRISDVLPLEKAAEAQRLNETGKAHGKVVIHVQ
ncbi:NADP-dependent oxidoreductase [Bdellovibrio reynosensis]|uniref:NADP-dependent oxidoreductase n=1 Tax=Bdellovibrio reynosensis TaxID=2835041 RepID=A0ABY4CBV1_9BACT|nr:NADP-dependent oxidoreductase [Bdellovibrio reynosensis]UOF02452.1 NADP-dependent oxidoreductase [Bdellovibrio reynosensis]